MPQFQFLGVPKAQYLDSSGDPLSGGKLYSYEPGTTTPKATYPTIADAIAGTNANANPIILDSRGEADLVLSGETKLKLDDSTDNTIWTVDNVNSSSDLIDENGNSWVNFTTVSNAVNAIDIKNSATGNAPVLSVSGDDTNIDLDIQPKGSSGSINLKDGNGNELLIPTSVASAVNEFTVKNAATGNNPELSATGNDTNIGINLQSKGTGTYNLLGTATASANLRLYEDTDNGSNYIQVAAPASITSNRTITLADEDVTLSVSTQAEMEAASSTTDFVTPGRTQYHPGVAKAWCNFQGSGTAAILTSHNVTSITDNGTGDYRVTWDTDFSSANYCAVVTCEDSTNTRPLMANIDRGTAVSAGTIDILLQSLGSGGSTYTPEDADVVNVVAFGDQS